MDKPKLELVAAGTLRNMAKRYGVPDAPGGCTHASLWRQGSLETVVYERPRGGRDYAWDGAAWVAREPHYQALRNLG